MKNSIVICMGSSCFARGNREHLEKIENFIEARDLSVKVRIAGCRCRNECGKGPNLEINGQLHHEVDSGTLLDLLEHYFPATESV